MISELQKIVGKERVRGDELERLCYSRDMSVHEGNPDAIVFPETTEEVVKILKYANKKKIPVVPRGAGTSVVGAMIAPKGGIILDMTKMNRIITVKPEDLYAEVEPGVIYADLDKELAPHNVFFPPDPGSISVCTIGGMVGTNASGIHAVKYGTTKDYILGLEVVLPTGKVITVGSKVIKTSTGLDLTRLFVGSEGTLGVITRIIVKLVPKPRYVTTAIATFDSLIDAGKAISKILGSRIVPAVIEIMDRTCIEVLNKVANLGLPSVEGVVLFETDGHPEAAKDDMRRIIEICRKNGSRDVKESDNPTERLNMWKGRKSLISALSVMKEGYRNVSVGEDIGVPISKIPEAIKSVQEISKKYGIVIATFGHVGDGNLHPVMIVDVRSPKQWKHVKDVANALIKLALGMGGTITTEHGIGFSKSMFVDMELGTTMELQNQLKLLFDPNNIMNPGNMGFGGKTDVLAYFAFSEILKKRKGPLSKHSEDEMLKCIMCGFCRAVCPIFSQMGMESFNAKGRVIMAYYLQTGKLKPSKELMDKFLHCTTCMHCFASCPARTEVSEIVEEVRGCLAEKGFTHPSHVTVKENILTYHNPFGEGPQQKDELKKIAEVV